MGANAKIVLEAAEHAVKHNDKHHQARWVGIRQGDEFIWRQADGKPVEGEFDVAASNGDAPPCGTTLCLGGWIAFLNAEEGSKITYRMSGYWSDEQGNVVDPPGRDSIWHSEDQGTVRFPDGSTESVPAFAVRIAGLSEGQMNALFYNAKNHHVLPMAQALAANPEASQKEILAAAGLDEYGEEPYDDEE